MPRLSSLISRSAISAFLRSQKDPFRVGEQHFSRFRHLHALSHAQKELAAHLALQELDMLADGRLRKMKLISGAAEPAAGHGRMKHAKLMQVHRSHRSEGLNDSILHILRSVVKSKCMKQTIRPLRDSRGPEGVHGLTSGLFHDGPQTRCLGMAR